MKYLEKHYFYVEKERETKEVVLINIRKRYLEFVRVVLSHLRYVSSAPYGYGELSLISSLVVVQYIVSL